MQNSTKYFYNNALDYKQKYIYSRNYATQVSKQ